MKIAFYKGRTRFLDRIVQWWTRSPYSHCEIVFDSVNNLCATSSFIDGGVRIKLIELDEIKWDVVDVDGDENAVLDWFMLHLGEKYDLLGLVGFIIPISGWRNRWFCSEACAASLGYAEAWRFSPAMLYSIINRQGQEPS